MESVKDMRILYMGTPDFAVLPLKCLVEGGYNVVGVITAPDKPAGRGLKVHESAVKKYAAEQGLRIYQPEKLKNQSFLKEIKDLAPDIGIVIAFRMLPEILWSMPKYGTFNLHASLLPQYRGAAPINWAIINGEKTTGVTTFMLNSEIDKGDIILQKEVAVAYEDTAGTLHDKLMFLGADAVLKTVDAIFSDTYKARVQNFPEDELKTAPKIFKETCKINWNQDTESIRNLVRGLSPYPGAWTELEVKGTIVQFKVFEVAVHRSDEISGKNPGDIISDEKKELHVVCGGGILAINKLQPAGKRRMSAEEFLRGFKNIGNSKFV
ncbi:MAG: methionyl-tRNA formyltransferase [Rikenellaceae bacterium]|nr:methionyl-tRNA formyltransferase [Rikenellaceae bacterium]